MLENPTHQTSLHDVNVSDQVQIRQFAVDVIAKHKRVDILINNAGLTIAPTPFDDLSDESFERIIATNMWGVYFWHSRLPTVPEGPSRSKHYHDIQPGRSDRFVRLQSICNEQIRCPGTFREPVNGIIWHAYPCDDRVSRWSQEQYYQERP